VTRAPSSLSTRAACALSILLALAGCDAPRATVGDAGMRTDGEAPIGPVDPVAADVVIAAPGATGEGFGDPANAVNGVRGGGPNMGSLDVYSLGYGENAELVLAWSGHSVANGPGADFAVFENGFLLAGAAGAYFMDLAVVSVSRDGETWVELPHDYVALDESRYSFDPADWEGFAGRWPVLLNDDTNPADPFDPQAAGGDTFDLDVLDHEGEAGVIRREGFRYLRLSAAPTRTNPDTGAAYPRDPTSNGPDIDGVIARWLVADR
jgi:hypothetical protein